MYLRTALMTSNRDFIPQTSSTSSLMDRALLSAGPIKRLLITFVEAPLRRRLLMKEHITTTLSNLSRGSYYPPLIRVTVISNWGPLLLTWNILLTKGTVQKPNLAGITFMPLSTMLAILKTKLPSLKEKRVG